MTGLEYEKYCVSFLEKKGFSDVYNTQGSGDQGVDIIADKDDLKWAFQCKYFDSTVGNKAIQEVFAGSKYYDCDKAIVITNSTFTKSACELAQKLGVDLWDNIYPYSPYVELDSEISDDDYEANGEEKVSFCEKYYYSFSFEDRLFFVKEDFMDTRDYYKDNARFLEVVANIEKTLPLYKKGLFNKKPEKDQDDYLLKCIDNLLEYDACKDVFLINWNWDKDFVFRYSNVNKSPININLIKKIDNHFNMFSKVYYMNAFKEQDEEIFDIVISPRTTKYDNRIFYENYNKYFDLDKIDKYHSKKEIFHLTEMNEECSYYFRGLIKKMANYISYDIKFRSADKRPFPLDINYLNDEVFLYDAIIYEESGMIYMRFLCELNNRAKYDEKYKDIIKNCDSLLISLRMNVVDFYIYADSRMKIREYPELLYSYVDSRPFKQEQELLISGQKQYTDLPYQFLHQNNFIYASYN